MLQVLLISHRGRHLPESTYALAKVSGDSARSRQQKPNKLGNQSLGTSITSQLRPVVPGRRSEKNLLFAPRFRSRLPKRIL